MRYIDSRHIMVKGRGERKGLEFNVIVAMGRLLFDKRANVDWVMNKDTGSGTLIKLCLSFLFSFFSLLEVPIVGLIWMGATVFAFFVVNVYDYENRYCFLLINNGWLEVNGQQRLELLKKIEAIPYYDRREIIKTTSLSGEGVNSLKNYFVEKQFAGMRAQVKEEHDLLKKYDLEGRTSNAVFEDEEVKNVIENSTENNDVKNEPKRESRVLHGHGNCRMILSQEALGKRKAQ